MEADGQVDPRTADGSGALSSVRTAGELRTILGTTTGSDLSASRPLPAGVLVRLFLAGVALMAATMTVIALSNAAGFSFPGLALLLEFLIFMGLFPTLMGLFVSVTPEQTGRRVAEREIRQSYYPRR